MGESTIIPVPHKYSGNLQVSNNIANIFTELRLDLYIYLTTIQYYLNSCLLPIVQYGRKYSNSCTA